MRLGPIVVVVIGLLPALPARVSAETAELVRSGRYAEAEKVLEPLAARSGKAGGEAKVALGRIQLETGRYEDAARTAKSVRGVPEVRSAALLLEGEARLRVGQVAEAVEALRAAVEAAGRSGAAADERRARLLLARALARQGDLLAARPLWEALADDYNDGNVSEQDPVGLWAVASAVASLEYYQDANETYALATKADPRRVETQTDWARLFLEKYDPGHAEECLRDALAANPAHAEAHLLMAKVRMQQGFDFVRAGQELDLALATDPNLAEAYAFRATIHVRDRLWERAHEDLDRALAVDPTHPYALAVRAATYYVADDRAGYERTVAALRARHRRATAHYAVLTDLLEWEHRYEEIVALNREALGLDASYWPAHAAIGLNLLRIGEDEPGIAALRESRRHDRFHVLVFNTLSLHDEVLSRDYEYTKRGAIRYRFHKNDQKVLSRYLPDLLERGYREMSKRYRVRPARTTVEVFASEDHFARRSVGLPRVGVQGICFGPVVVAAGPRAVPVNYGQVLWHELGHVFSIHLSKARVPRWLTEGLAVNEEARGDPSWTRGEDGVHYRWVKAGRMPPVASLNTAFSRARSPAEVGLAYYASAKLAAYVEERHGWDKVLRMLELHGRGLRTGEVVEQALGLTAEELDAAFREHTLKTLAGRARSFQVDYGWHYDREAIEARARAPGAGAAAHGQAAVAAMASRDAAAAGAWAEQAIRLDPAQPEARHVLSDLAAATGNLAAAREHAQALISKGVDGYALRLNLAEAAEKAGDRASALRELEAAARLDDQQVEPIVRMAKVHLDAGREAEALVLLGRAADLEQHDRGLHRELVARLVKRGQWDEVRRRGERALWVDPFDAELHVSLARSHLRGGDPRRAAFEYDSALLCEPEATGPIHLAMAQAYREAGRTAEATRAARSALRAAPESAEARTLLDELTSPARGAGSGSRRR